MTLDAGSSLANYLWSDGNNSQTMTVSAAGNYSVTATDFNGCTNADTIEISVVVPSNNNLQDVTLNSLACFSATQTITVAGGGTTFVVQQGGSATLIAGRNIIFLPGATVDPGGYLHGYITPDNLYCGGVSLPAASPVNPLMAATNQMLTGQTTVNQQTDNLFKLYPNPSTGVVTLEVGNPTGTDVRIEIRDMTGRLVYARTFNGMHFIGQVNLGNFPDGVYAVKAGAGNLVRTTKLVLIK